MLLVSILTEATASVKTAAVTSIKMAAITSIKADATLSIMADAVMSALMDPVASVKTDSMASIKADAVASMLDACGSMTWDQEHDFNLEWESLEDFHKWHENEQRAHGIELCTAHTKRPRGSVKQSTVFNGSQLFVCVRQGTSGIKHYEKKTNHESRDTKRIESGCPCHVRIKTYPHTSTILGRYAPNHSHPTSKDNLKYIWIRVPTLEQITGLIRLGLTDREIKKCMRAQFSEDERDHYLTLDEIAWVRKAVNREIVELNPNDANSTRIWADNLRGDGHLVFYKSKQELPPEGSNLTRNLFAFCIQMTNQLEWFRCLGNTFLGIDATHNVTQYKGLLLFTIMAQDH
ncbi:hypothetical protein EDB83DRAFT_2526514 [Lactarius deliciosus]|nr:hypothetical protein EDB83DRAFT_2526514 [Lactarius deliciosus]